MKFIKVLFVVGCIFIVDQSFAQVRFDLGLKGGLNFAGINTHSSLTDNYKNRTGYHVGAYFNLKITKFAIQPEILFSKQSQTYSFPSVNSTQSFTQSFNYINIPILVKFYLLGGLNVYAGPQFGFLANQSSNITALNTQTNATTSQKISDFVKSSDVSLALGLGWDLPLGLNVTARYSLGLSDINKKSGVNSQYIQSSMGTETAKNQVIQVSVGYRLFKLGK